MSGEFTPNNIVVQLCILSIIHSRTIINVPSIKHIYGFALSILLRLIRGNTIILLYKYVNVITFYLALNTKHISLLPDLNMMLSNLAKNRGGSSNGFGVSVDTCKIIKTLY